MAMRMNNPIERPKQDEGEQSWPPSPVYPELAQTSDVPQGKLFRRSLTWNAVAGVLLGAVCQPALTLLFSGLASLIVPKEPAIFPAKPVYSWIWHGCWDFAALITALLFVALIRRYTSLMLAFGLASVPAAIFSHDFIERLISMSIHGLM